jgi:hypothetical protein
MLSGSFAEMTTSTPFRDILHAAKSTTWEIVIYFHVNFNVLKQNCCALVGVKKSG